jgi:hypothetical protein
VRISRPRLNVSYHLDLKGIVTVAWFGKIEKSCAEARDTPTLSRILFCTRKLPSIERYFLSRKYHLYFRRPRCQVPHIPGGAVTVTRRKGAPNSNSVSGPGRTRQHHVFKLNHWFPDWYLCMSEYLFVYVFVPTCCFTNEATCCITNEAATSLSAPHVCACVYTWLDHLFKYTWREHLYMTWPSLFCESEPAYIDNKAVWEGLSSCRKNSLVVLSMRLSTVFSKTRYYSLFPLDIPCAHEREQDRVIWF